MALVLGSFPVGDSVHWDVEHHHPVERQDLLSDIIEEELEAGQLYVEERLHTFDGAIVQFDASYIGHLKRNL
jgi:hypothetical protein